MTSTGKLRRGLLGGQQSLARFVQRGHGLDDQQVHAGVSKGANLFRKGGARFIQAGLAQRLQPHAQRTDGAGDPGFAGLLFLEMVHGLPGQLHAGGVDLGHLSGQSMARQAETVGAKGVGFKNLRAGLQIFLVDGEDQVGIGKVQFVVAAVDEDAAGVEHRAHGAVGEHGAAGEDVGEAGPCCCHAIA